jgi:hypothetical protein
MGDSQVVVQDDVDRMLVSGSAVSRGHSPKNEKTGMAGAIYN